jgi:hypothetical protein
LREDILIDLALQVRVLELLHQYAGQFGEATPRGVQVSRSCTGAIAIELGIHDRDVTAMLVRLRRLKLAILTDSGAILLPDLPRLEDFARFVATQRREPPHSMVTRIASPSTAADAHIAEPRAVFGRNRMPG